MLNEDLVLPDDSPRVLIVERLLVNAHNLQLLDQVVSHFVVVDALSKRAFLGDDLELADLKLKCFRNLNDDLPDLLVCVHSDLLSHIVWVQDDQYLLILLIVVLADVLSRDMHVVKMVDVGPYERHPVEAHVKVA